MRKVAWVGALTGALLAGCEVDYACGPLVYSEAENRCVCPPGSEETEDGRCILADGGVLYPPGWDGSIDEDAGAPTTCPDGRAPRELFEDADGDGHGRIGSGAVGCEGVTLGDDCDDACRDCYPGAIEICDGRDNDCSSGPDDTFACVRGAATECETTCGSTGVVACGLDCAVPTGATCTPPEETCNRADDDCDALTDEGVLAFGEPVDWTALAGDQLRIEARDGGAVAVYISDTGIVARLIDEDGALVGSAVELVRVANADFLDTDVRGGTLYAAYAVGTTFPAHDLYVLSADLAALTVTAGPRRIAQLTSSPGALHVEQAFGTMVFYEPSTGSGIRMRAGTDIATSAFAERIVTSGFAGGFDVVAPGFATTRAYVAYAGRSSSAEDYEIYVQPMTTSGVDGPALRLTDDALDDDRPVLAGSSSDLAVAWRQRADDSALVGVVRAAAIPGGSGTPRPAIDASPIGPLGTYAIAAPAGGWSILTTERVSDSQSRLTHRPLTRDVDRGGESASIEAPEMMALPVGTVRIAERLWTPVALIGETNRLEARPIDCL